MKPTTFKEQNVVYAKNQPEYISLPAFRNNSKRGEVVSCWKLSFIERIIVLFTGRVWLSLLSFNKPLTPSLLAVKKSEVLITKNGLITKLKHFLRLK